jgi:cobalamin biosynthetic protein CobC
MIPELAAPAGAKAVVLVNPNNPDGRSWPPGQVLAVADEMAARGGVLIVDEAFADAEPGLSAAPYTGRDGLIVLRSFGKFFGLAGVRLGFALGPAAIIEKLDAALGPWAVSGPAIEIGTAALADLAWREAARARYGELAARLDALLTDAGLQIIGGTALFRLASHAQAGELHAHLASRSIWARRFEDHPRWLRFGLPGTEPAFARLAAALHSFSQSSQR